MKKQTPFEKQFNTQNEGSRSHIIVDRKKKRHYYMMDEQVNDPLGLEKAKENKQGTLEIDSKSDDVVDKFIVANGYQALIGKKAYGYKKDTGQSKAGYIISVLASKILLVKHGGKTLPMPFNTILAIGD